MESRVNHFIPSGFPVICFICFGGRRVAGFRLLAQENAEGRCAHRGERHKDPRKKWHADIPILQAGESFDERPQAFTCQP